MAEKAKEKARAKKGTGELISSFVVLMIVLSVLTASVATVSSSDVMPQVTPPPPPPSIDAILVTADPTKIPADGLSRSTITATVMGTNITGANLTVYFSIKSQPPGCGAVLTNSSYTIYSYSGTNRNATTELIAGIVPGDVTIEASCIDKKNTTTVKLVPAPKITNWYNNKTKNNALSVTINESECVYFNATADQPIVTWRWFVDGVNQSRNFDNFTYCGWSRNGTYNVKVNGTNANGTSNTVTWTVTVNDITPPAKVTGLTNSTPTYTTVDLWWNANLESDLVGYKIYQDGALRGTTPNTYYNVTGLSAGTTYKFNVSAYDDNGLEGENATVMVTTPGYPAPTIINWYNNKTKNNATTVTVNESECVYFNATANQPINTWRWFVNDSDQAHNFDNFIYCGWSVNGTYYVKVNGTNVNGTSNTVMWTVTVNDITPPAKVMGLTNGTPTYTTVDLWWNANLESDLVGYKIYQDGALRGTTPNTYYNVTGLSAGTTYKFNVSAYDDNGLEGENATVMVTTPVSPLSITITSPVNKTYASICVRLNFTVEPEGTTLVWIGYSLDGGANVTITGNTTVGGLSADGHNIVVYANDTVGTMAASNKVYFTVHPGDINGDKTVDGFDLQRLAWAYGSKPGDPDWNEDANLNCDTTIDGFDLQRLAWNYGNNYGV